MVQHPALSRGSRVATEPRSARLARHMAWKVGAAGTAWVGSQGIVPGARDGPLGKIVPLGPTHAVNSETGKVACGVLVARLIVLPDMEWESASVEKCPDCVRVVASV